MRVAMLPIMLLLFANLTPAFPEEARGTKLAEDVQVSPDTKSQQPARGHLDRMRRDHMRRLLEHRDWDHRKAGRDWRLRRDHENVERY